MFFYLHDYGKLPLDQWYCNSRFSFVAVILMGSYFKSSFFFGRFCFLDNLSDRCSTVRYMYVERHMIKLPTTIYRFCPVRNSGISEDECHLLLHCLKYSIPREKFYHQIQHNVVDSNQLSSTELHCIN